MAETGAERRDGATRERLLENLRGELSNLPGLALTPGQAARLFNIPPEVCVRLFLLLEEQGSVKRREDGRVCGVPPQ